MLQELDQGLFVGFHTHCLASEFPIRANGKVRKSCSSSDGLAIYEHETKEGEAYYDGVCYSCRQGFTRDEVHTSSIASQLGIPEGQQFVKNRKNFENKATKKNPVTVAERTILWKKTGWEANGFRGFRDDVLQFYGHRTELDKDGKVVAQYYPETSNEGILNGYKSCHEPKKYGYGNLGITGLNNQLSGQHRFPEGGKYALVVAGEKDKIAAQMMLMDYQKSKGQGDYNPYSVVSPTTGEPSAAKQCRQQYEWFDKHDIIIIGMDNDEVGREAAEEIAKVLPKQKVRIAKWSLKDPNQMLQEQKSRQFMSDFWGAEEYIQSGIVGASKIELSIFEEIELEKVTLPPFMSVLQSHMAGGIPLGYIINLIADTGCGKTTIANECVYHWIFESPHKVGIISLELDVGQYGISLLSRHLGKKLQLFTDPNEAKAFLNLDHNVVKRKQLWQNDFGEERFYLLDDRDGSLESLKKKIQQMIIQYECRFIVIDPLQDILDGYSNEDQAVFMKWMKQMVKAYKVSFFNINHVRKEGNSGFDRFLKESDIQGSSSIAKSAGCNIIFTRDKLAEDDVTKNVTKVFLPKCRWTGSTGDGGLWYYSLDKHTVYDMNTYFRDNPSDIPEGLTLEELMENQNEIHRKKDKKITRDKGKPLVNNKAIVVNGVSL